MVQFPTSLTGAVGGLVATAVTALVVRAIDTTPPASFVPTRGSFAAAAVAPSPRTRLAYGIAAGLLYVPLLRPLVRMVHVPLFVLHGGVLWGTVYGVGLFVLGSLWVRVVLNETPDAEAVMSDALLHLVFGVSVGLWVAYVGWP